MSYTTSDFSESLLRAPLKAEQIESVVAAWGRGDGQGSDAGHFQWAENGVTDWSGGFLMRLKDGRFAYLTGWCDYTGWGCQDGVRLAFFDHEPSMAEMQDAASNESRDEPEAWAWDREPADLNRWLAAGAHDSDASTGD